MEELFFLFFPFTPTFILCSHIQNTTNWIVRRDTVIYFSNVTLKLIPIPNVIHATINKLVCETASLVHFGSLYFPVTSITSSSELLPPFSVVSHLSGWLRAAPSRLAVGLLNWERKLDVLELELGTGNPLDPERRGLGNNLGSESSD